MRFAVFVDAGYLLAQGSVSPGANRPDRSTVALDLSSVTTRLLQVAHTRANESSLLRIYWYDGMPRGGQSPQHEAIARMEDVKLRLGSINSYGRQKGVDALIMADLMELARNHAISDAVLLTGDEDLRICVQIAQSFGVRVHLLGIGAGGNSQSLPLQQEADTTTYWSVEDLRTFMTLREDDDRTISVSAITQPPNLSETLAQAQHISLSIEDIANVLVSSLNPVERAEIAALGQFQLISPKYDRPLLARARNMLNRQLTDDERIRLRHLIRAVAEADPLAP